MSRVRQKKESARETVACLSCAAAVLLALVYTLFAVAGSWALWVEWSSFSVCMEIKILDESFFELRVDNGSHHRKEKMDSQKDRLDSWGNGSAVSGDLCVAERGW
ncbi:MAG: hypothetical protein KAJ19_19755 [Gammaproteobacteria bacterium]|nr:hypothetical protein [Gammaproteobacteria bacterium]